MATLDTKLISKEVLPDPETYELDLIFVPISQEPILKISNSVLPEPCNNNPHMVFEKRYSSITNRFYWKLNEL